MGTGNTGGEIFTYRGLYREEGFVGDLLVEGRVIGEFM